MKYRKYMSAFVILAMLLAGLMSSHVVLAKGGGSSEGGTKKDTSGGLVTLNVAVTWPDDLKHPDEVEVTLTKYTTEDDETVIPTPFTETTVDGVATFTTEPTGDKCEISGQNVPGFLVEGPKSVSLTGDVKVVDETLGYSMDPNPNVSISLNTNVLTLAPGYSEKLTAAVEPYYAEISWSPIYDPDVADNPAATVDSEGEVQAGQLPEGVTTGSVTITAENSYGPAPVTAACEVTVSEIENLTPPDDISAFSGEYINLPRTVKATLFSGYETQLDVVWGKTVDDLVVDYYYQVPEGNTDILTGYLTGYDEEIIDYSSLTTTLTIDIFNTANSIVLSQITASLYWGDYADEEDTKFDLTAYTDIAGLQWASSDENIAIITSISDDMKTATVTAQGPGTAYISVNATDGPDSASCIVNVAEAIAPSLIYPCKEDGTAANEFSEPDMVYINLSNLIEYYFDTYGVDMPDSSIYNIKVEEASGTLLGEGVVTVESDPAEPLFKLYDCVSHDGILGFKETDDYSNQYYIYMSTEPDYPRGDDMTLSTNFKVGSAVPTFDTDDINVQAVIERGNWGPPDGIVFILCRETEPTVDRNYDGILDLRDVSWIDYLVDKNNATSFYNKYDPNNPQSIADLFTDEAKLMGITNIRGFVTWYPDLYEPVKLGGYYLLEVTPPGYQDNLNELDPEGDGSYLKEVSLTRDGTVDRIVYNTYISLR